MISGDVRLPRSVEAECRMRDRNKGKLIRGKLISGRGRVRGYEEQFFFTVKNLSVCFFILQTILPPSIEINLPLIDLPLPSQAIRKAGFGKSKGDRPALAFQFRFVSNRRQ